MWFIANGMLNNNTTLLEMGIECIGYVLPTLVIAEGLDLVPSLSFCISLESLKCREDLKLVAKRNDCPEM